MFDVRKPKQKPIVVIRTATQSELSSYEKRKLANIEENAQENKIEIISMNVGGVQQQLEPLNKEVRIDLGSLAGKSKVTPSDLTADELFFIKCELDSKQLDEHN